MPFFIVNSNGIYPVEYGTYELASAHCEAGEYVYIADSLEFLEECLDAESGREEGLADSI